MADPQITQPGLGAATASSLTVTGAVSAGSLAATGAVTGASAALTGAVTAASVAATGLVSGADVQSSDVAALVKSGSTLNTGAGAGAGTIANAPAAGNPTKWIPIVDNGVTRFIPAW